MSSEGRMKGAGAMLDTIVAAADPSFDRIARIVRDALCVPTALATVAIDDRLYVPGAVGLAEPAASDRVVPLSQSFCQHVVFGDTPLVISDARTDTRLAELPAVLAAEVIAYAGFPLRDGQGTAVGSLCAIHPRPHVWDEVELRTLDDLAQLCSTELALRDTQQQLSQSYEQLIMFAGQVSHDLKTPLTAMIGFTELLSELPSVAADEAARAWVARCTSSGHRMFQTITQLLAYAAVGGTLQLMDVALAEVMSAVVEDLADVVDGADITWTGPDLFGDLVQLRSLLQNLVGNSLKYRSKDRRCTVSVTVVELVSCLELRVCDNGTGIPRDRRSEVVLPLSRLRRDVPGSGLGLATCDRIAVAHGGVLQIGETAGGGTTVTVLLPALRAPVPPD